MPHRATAEEERRLAKPTDIEREQSLDAAVLVDSLPTVTMRVVFLGSHPHKTVRLNGTIVQETIKDPDNPEDREKWTYLVTGQSKHGATKYDFSTVDANGRKLPAELLVPEGIVDGQGRSLAGKRFQMVSHYGHLAEFWNMRDADKQPMFSVRGSKQALDLVKRFVEATRRARPRESGAAVLEDMGL